MMKPKPSLYAVVLYFFLMVGLSWEVGAFSEADLEKLKATKECNKCDLSGANLIGADLTEAYLYRADLDEANLTGTIFCGTIMPDGSYNDSGC